MDCAGSKNRLDSDVTGGSTRCVGPSPTRHSRPAVCAPDQHVHSRTAEPSMVTLLVVLAVTVIAALSIVALSVKYNNAPVAHHTPKPECKLDVGLLMHCDNDF